MLEEKDRARMKYKISDRIPKPTIDLYLFCLAIILVIYFSEAGQYGIAENLGCATIGGLLSYVRNK